MLSSGRLRRGKLPYLGGTPRRGDIPFPAQGRIRPAASGLREGRQLSPAAQVRVRPSSVACGDTFPQGKAVRAAGTIGHSQPPSLREVDSPLCGEDGRSVTISSSIGRASMNSTPAGAPRSSLGEGARSSVPRPSCPAGRFTTRSVNSCSEGTIHAPGRAQFIPRPPAGLLDFLPSLYYCQSREYSKPKGASP